MGRFSKRNPAEFVPNRDTRLLAFDGDRLVDEVEDGKVYRLRTEGLKDWDRPELEIAGVPLPAIESAAVLLNMAAGYTVAVRRVRSGENWAAEDVGRLVLAATMIESEPGVLRLCPLAATTLTEAPPLAALAHRMVMTARERIEMGDEESARALLMNAIELFPGTATTRRDVIAGGTRSVNQENHLAYLALARLVDEDEKIDRLYRAALRRAPELLEYELGAAELRAFSRDRLLLDAAELVHNAQTGAGGEPWGDERIRKAEQSTGAHIMGLVASPVLVRGEDGALYQGMNAAIVPFRRYFYEEPVASALRTPAVLSLAADVYERLRETPADLAVLTREAREIFLAPATIDSAYGEDSRVLSLIRSSRREYEPHLIPLSAILADLGRRIAARLDLEELRASVGFGEESAKARAAEKLARASDAELDWYSASMTLSSDDE